MFLLFASSRPSLSSLRYFTNQRTFAILYALVLCERNAHTSLESVPTTYYLLPRTLRDKNRTGKQSSPLFPVTARLFVRSRVASFALSASYRMPSSAVLHHSPLYFHCDTSHFVVVNNVRGRPSTVTFQIFSPFLATSPPPLSLPLHPTRQFVVSIFMTQKPLPLSPSLFLSPTCPRTVLLSHSLTSKVLLREYFSLRQKPDTYQFFS